MLVFELGLVAPLFASGQAAATNEFFVFEGDSITAGVGVPAESNYPSQLMQTEFFKRRGEFQNRGQNGDTLGGMLGEYRDQVYPKRPEAIGTRRTTVFLWAGINDLPKRSAAEIKLDLEYYWRRAKLHGFTVVAFTLTPRSGGYRLDDAKEAVRQDVNQWIRTSTIPDQIIDVANVLTNSADSKMFQDGIHPNRKGFELVVAEIVRVMGSSK